MNRHVVAGMVGLVLAGCASTRTDPSQSGRTLPPVGLTEFPSIYETIVRDNPRIDPARISAERLNGPGRSVSTDPRYAANAPRPAPYAETPPPAAPRPQAVAAQPAQAPATADNVVAGAIPPPPIAPGPAAAPPANPMPPVGEPGPALAANPDVMPSAEASRVATATEATPGSEASKPAEAAVLPALAETKPAPEAPTALAPTPEPAPAPALSSLAETKPAAEMPKDLAPDLNPASESKPPGEPSPALPSATVAETKPAVDPTPAPAPAAVTASVPAAPLPKPDPSLAAEPDVMPAMVPAAAAAVASSTKAPVPAMAPLPRPDPSLAADPDVMPVLPSSPSPVAERPSEPPASALNPNPAPLPTPATVAAPEPELPPLVGQPMPSAAAPSQPRPEAQPEPALPELPAAMPPLSADSVGRPDPSLAAEPDVMPPLPPSLVPASPAPASTPMVPQGAQAVPLPLKDAQTAPASATAPQEPEEELSSVPPIDLPPLPPLDPKQSIPTPPALAKPPTLDGSLTRTGLSQTAPASAPKPVLPTAPAPLAPPKAADPAEPAELPLPTMPPATPLPAAPAAPTKPESAAAADPAVQPAAVSSSTLAAAEIRSTGRPVDYKEAGRAAAIVGDEVITVHELANALNDRMRGVPPGHQFSPQEQRMMQMAVLHTLIERSVIYQEAKRIMKDPKKISMITGIADKVFREEELPPMMSKAGVTNEYEMKQKMAESGLSFDEIREQFRRDFVCQGYVEQKLGPKMKVELPEMYDYYYAHQHDFDGPARITWREVVIEVSKNPSRAAAKQKADAVLGRLRRGEDFAQVARSESDGPNKTAGGLWETSPGSYAVTQVNDALSRLPLSQISPVIEAPGSYHIVRLEKQRDAGPATFPEVQDKIHRILRKEKIEREKTAFVKKLRAQMAITTMFDPQEDAPTTQAASPQP